MDFSEKKQKNDTPIIPLIELSKIHPALQFIAELNYKEMETLLSWATKAPHMEVAITKLEKIITKLKGTIDTSTGGSHHRIVFTHSLAFVDTLEQNSTENETKEKTAKGTLIRQHGKAKSSRFLPSYALKTFMQTLHNMGVTKTILGIYQKASQKPTVCLNRELCLTNAQIALEKDQIKMLLFSGFYHKKSNSNLKKLVDVSSKTQRPFPGDQQNLVKKFFAFL